MYMPHNACKTIGQLKSPPTNKRSRQDEYFTYVEPKDPTNYVKEIESQEHFCISLTFKHLRKKYSTLYVNSTTIRQMMEKDEP